MTTPFNERVKHASDILLAISEGKQLVAFAGDARAHVPGIVNNCLNGWWYTVAPPSTAATRPFTPKEADRLIGCVLIRPTDGLSGTVLRVCCNGNEVCWTPWVNPTLQQLHEARWHYRIPGSGSVELLECWVTLP